MKKLLIFLVGIALLLSLVSCSGGDMEESAPDVPPGFTVIQNRQKLKKHGEKGESAAFSKEEFVNFLGEDLSFITVTELPEQGTLICNGNPVLKGQTVPADELEFMKFLPTAECETAFFNFTCDSAGYYGKEMCCDMVFGSEINTPPVALDSTLKTVEGISCFGELSIREPNGDEYTINVITYPTDGYINVNAHGEVVYTPEKGFFGNDKLVYSVTDCFGKISETATLKIQVAENQSGITFADMEENPNHLYAHQMCENNVMVYRSENGEYYFDPDNPVSKMDFLVMLMCVAEMDRDITAVADSVADDDTGLSSGLKGYLSEAYNCGLIKLNDGKFMPKESITVADAAYMTAAALNLPLGDSQTATGEETAVYNAVSAAVYAGLLDAEDGAVDTKAILTKSDAARLLWGISNYIKDNNIQK